MDNVAVYRVLSTQLLLGLDVEVNLVWKVKEKVLIVDNWRDKIILQIDRPLRIYRDAVYFNQSHTNSQWLLPYIAVQQHTGTATGDYVYSMMSLDPCAKLTRSVRKDTVLLVEYDMIKSSKGPRHLNADSRKWGEIKKYFAELDKETMYNIKGL